VLLGRWNANEIMCTQFTLLCIYFKRYTNQDLVGKICFRFCMVQSESLRSISSKFYSSNIGTVHDRVL